jgi:hypothetical protein
MSKKPQDVIKGFKAIFAADPIRPSSLRADNGKEFSAHAVQKFMKDDSINIYYTKSPYKANYVESFLRTLKRRLWKIFQYRSSYRYIDILPKVIDSYNRTPHSSLNGLAPADIDSENERQLWYQTYFPPKKYQSAFRDARKHHTGPIGKRPKRRSPFSYNLGDSVRLHYSRGKFTRDYDQSQSGEIFFVKGRRLDQGLPIYYLRDYSGDDLEGAVYPWEITKVKFDPQQPFRIDRVLKTRTKAGKTESYVTFEGWPAKYAQWIPNNQMIDLLGKGQKSRLAKIRTNANQ